MAYNDKHLIKEVVSKARSRGLIFKSNMLHETRVGREVVRQCQYATYGKVQKGWVATGSGQSHKFMIEHDDYV